MHVFEELFVSPLGLEQRIVGGGGMVRVRRGRHPLETVRFVACVKAECQRLIKLPLFLEVCICVNESER